MEDKEIKGFTFYRTFYNVTKELSSKDRLALYDAIMNYIFADKEPNLNGLLAGLWSNFSLILEKSKKKSRAGQTTNQSNNETKSNQNQNEIKSETNNIFPFNFNLLNNNLESNRGTGEEKTLKKFTKPTIEEIKDYCKERKNKVDADSFYDFYESKGWKVGNQSMKDWKACIRTWEQRMKKSSNEKPVPEWFNQKNESEEIAEKEQEELKEMMKEFK